MACVNFGRISPLIPANTWSCGKNLHTLLFATRDRYILCNKMKREILRLIQENLKIPKPSGYHLSHLNQNRTLSMKSRFGRRQLELVVFPTQSSMIQIEHDVKSSQINSNKDAMLSLCKSMRKKIQIFENGGGEKAMDQLAERGKMSPRSRINALLDRGSPFLELSQFAGYEMYGIEDVPCGGIVTGIGLIAGRHCVVVANDPTVKGGAYYPITVKKHIRAQEIAMQNRCICIYLADSGGANISRQDEVFPDRFHFGRIFYNQAKMSSLGIPQITLVCGSCTAGGAYVPAMSDESIIVKNNGTIFLAGPPLVKAATGEEVTAEELGGADVHCRESGVADHYANDELQGIHMIRRIVAGIPLAESKDSKIRETSFVEEPLFDSEDLNGLAPLNLKYSIDCRIILSRILDGSRLGEFRPLYGSTLVCGFAHLYGIPVGVIANNGVLFPESSLKGAHFIELCSQRGIPLLFFQNITGFMVGREAERQGIAKHGAKLVTAVSCFDLPKIVLIFGSSYGAGNYGMCGRAYDPNFLFTWPNSKVAVMGGEQAAGVLLDIEKAARKKRKQEPLSPEDESRRREQLEKMYEERSHPYFASSRLWDDGIIEPSQTRKILGLALAVSLSNCGKNSKFGVFRM